MSSQGVWCYHGYSFLISQEVWCYHGYSFLNSQGMLCYHGYSFEHTRGVVLPWLLFGGSQRVCRHGYCFGGSLGVWCYRGYSFSWKEFSFQHGKDEANYDSRLHLYLIISLLASFAHTTFIFLFTSQAAKCIRDSRKSPV